MAHVKSHTSSFEHFCIFICEFRQLVCFKRIKSQHKFRLVFASVWFLFWLFYWTSFKNCTIHTSGTACVIIKTSIRMLGLSHLKFGCGTCETGSFFQCAHVASGDFRDIPFKRRNKQIDQLDAMTSAVPLRWNK